MLRFFSKTILFLLATLQLQQLVAQELNCKVAVISKKVAGVDGNVFKDLEKNIAEILNTTSWTGNEWNKKAKISCSFLLTIDELIDENTYQANLQIQANRPVFQSAYSTTLLNHKDKKVAFKFLPNEALQYSQSGSNNELVAILAFYANLIIGLDQDSFSDLGGTAAYKRAQDIVFQQGGQASNGGWSSSDKDINRYWIIKDFLAQKDLRHTLYTYHRKGLDKMVSTPQEGQKNLFESVKDLETLHNRAQNTASLHVFFDAKANEITQSALVLPQGERKRLYDLLGKINPGHLGIYKALE